MRVLKPVSIKWVDSYNIGQGWMAVDSMDKKDKYIYSVGILIFEDDNKVIITSAYGDGDSVCNPMAIPKKSIIKMVSLVPNGDEPQGDKPQNDEDGGGLGENPA